MATTLPHHLYGSFRQYKEDTDWCLQWLLDTAEAHGYDLDQYTSQRGGASSFHLKSADIRLLANFVSEQWPDIQISEVLIRRLDLAVRLRTLCATWFGSRDDPDLLEQNDRHRHSITLLVDIQSSFRPLFDKQPEHHAQRRRLSAARARHQAYAEDEADELAQQMEGVVVDEDISSAAVEISEEEYEIPTEDPKRKIVVDDQAEDDMQTIHAAVHCLLADIYKIRTYSVSAWTDYRDDKLGLSVVTLLNRVAMSLVVRLEHETLASQVDEQPLRYRTLMSPFYDGNLEQQPKIEAVQLSDDVSVDPLEFILVGGWTLSQVFLGGVHLKMYNRSFLALNSQGKKVERKRVRKSGLPGTPQFGDERVPMREDKLSADDISAQSPGHASTSKGWSYDLDTRALHFTQDELEALQSAYGVSLDGDLGRELTTSTHEDAFLLHFRSVFAEPKNISISSAFVGQLFADISGVLGSSGSTRAFNQLRHSAKVAKTTIRADSQHITVPANMPAAGTLNDPLANFPDRLGSNEAYSSPIHQHQQGFHDLLMNSPFACGSWQVSTISMLCMVSTNKVDKLQTVLSMLHLYNAVRQCGLLEATWPDMEYLIAVHSPLYLFYGDTPRTMEDCASKYTLSKGVSIKGKLPQTKATASLSLTKRSFWDHSFPTARLCLAHSQDPKKEGSGINLNDLALVLTELDLQGDRHKIKIDRGGNLLNREKLKAYSKLSRGSLTPMELLKRLRTQLELDMAHMGFDYLAMHRSCEAMLQYMKDEVETAGFFVENEKGHELETELLAETFVNYRQEGAYKMEAIVKGMEECLGAWKKHNIQPLCKDLPNKH